MRQEVRGWRHAFMPVMGMSHVVWIDTVNSGMPFDFDMHLSDDTL